MKLFNRKQPLTPTQNCWNKPHFAEPALNGKRRAKTDVSLSYLFTASKKGRLKTLLDKKFSSVLQVWPPGNDANFQFSFLPPNTGLEIGITQQR